MSIHFNCPQCNASLKVPDQAVGKKGKCPKCGASIFVPPSPQPQVHIEEDFQGERDASVYEYTDDEYRPVGLPPGTKMGLIALGIMIVGMGLIGVVIAVKAKNNTKVAEIRYERYNASSKAKEQTASVEVKADRDVNPLVWLIAVALYFLPASIAFMRRHQNAAAILAVNIFLGLTGVGWIAAMVWSLTASWRDEAAFRGYR